MIKEIEDILNGNYKVTEKQKMILKLRKQFLNELENAANIITEGYKYCPECKEYYKEKAWETETKTERREVCTFSSLVDHDDDRWEYKNCSVKYAICHMGHRFEEDVKVLRY